jgi:hypothetical protein
MDFFGDIFDALEASVKLVYARVGDVGVAAFVLAFLISILAFRSRPRNDGLARSSGHSEPMCPRCGGSRRFTGVDGKDWPCLEARFRHYDDTPSG